MEAISKTSIANLALGHLAIDVEIANVDTEQSKEARACRRFYDTTIRDVLKTVDWSFARAVETLQLASDDPPMEWMYAYTYPATSIAVRAVLPIDSVSLRIGREPKYAIGRGTAGRLILTNEPNARVRYTYLEDQAGRYTEDFALCASLLLAKAISNRLIPSDPNKLGLQALQLYGNKIIVARAHVANEEGGDQVPESEYILERDR